MPGTRSQGASINDSIQGWSLAAVTAAQILFDYISPAFTRIGAIKFYGITAGNRTTGTYVGDVLINGTSIWTVAGNKPTSTDATGAGEWNNAVPNNRAVRPGDRVTIQILTVPTGGTTDVSRVAATVALETD